MPGFLLHQGATVLCAHAGQAQPTAPSPRVRVSGQAIVTQPFPYVVAGCPFPPVSGGPCVSAQWLAGATEHNDSWWPHWRDWLAARSGRQKAAPVALGSARHRALAEAPGDYMLT